MRLSDMSDGGQEDRQRERESEGLTMATIPDADVYVVEAMRKFGGGFTSALAECFARADADNFARLKAAFPECWTHYEHLAELDRQRREAHR